MVSMPWQQVSQREQDNVNLHFGRVIQAISHVSYHRNGTVQVVIPHASAWLI